MFMLFCEQDCLWGHDLQAVVPAVHHQDEKNVRQDYCDIITRVHLSNTYKVNTKINQNIPFSHQ